MKFDYLLNDAEVQVVVSKSGSVVAVMYGGIDIKCTISDRRLNSIQRRAKIEENYRKMERYA